MHDRRSAIGDHGTELAARKLFEARLSDEPFLSLPKVLRPVNEEQAYAIQDCLHQILQAAGFGQQVGHKIGCTTEVMQNYLGIPNPCGGGVFAKNVQQSPGEFRYDQFKRVGVECELAVLMTRDLRPGDAPFSDAEIERAIGGLVPAIELVDDRYVNYGELDTPTLIADDFFAAGAVLGTDPIPWDQETAINLRALMRIDDVVVGRGVGSDILGNPLRALTWLVNSLAARGITVNENQFILLGSLVATVWVEPGQDVLVSVGEFEDVSVHFAGE